MAYKPNLLKQAFHSMRRAAASGWLAAMPAVQIAITGSQGKTNTSSAIYHILSGLAPAVRTDLNLDTIYNIPITALKIRPKTRYAVFELGIDHKGEMDLHLGIVRPKIAIVTGVSPVHTDREHLGSFENLVREKRKLVEALPPGGLAILNGDDPQVREMAKHTEAKVIFYGQGKNNDITASRLSLSIKGISFDLADTYFRKDLKSTRIQVPQVARHQIYTVMAAYAVYRFLGYGDMARFQALLNNLPVLPGRMSVETGPRGTTLINDSLRANPASTASGLKTLSLLKTAGKKIAVLAEMGELEKPEEEHAKIGMLLSGLDIDRVVAIGPLHEATERAAVAAGFPSARIVRVKNVIEAASALKDALSPGDVLYVKGSLLRHVERVLMILNGEKVVCDTLACPFYRRCPECRFLLKGYKP